MRERLSDRLGRTRITRGRISNEGPFFDSRNDSPVPSAADLKAMDGNNVSGNKSNHQSPFEKDKLIQMAKSYHRKASPVTIPVHTNAAASSATKSTTHGSTFISSSSMHLRRQRALARVKRTGNTPQATPERQQHEEGNDDSQHVATGRPQKFDFEYEINQQVHPTVVSTNSLPRSSSENVSLHTKEMTDADVASTSSLHVAKPPVVMRTTMQEETPFDEVSEEMTDPVTIIKTEHLYKPSIATNDRNKEDADAHCAGKASVATLDMIRKRITQKEGITVTHRDVSSPPVVPLTPDRPQSPLASIASIRARFGGTSKPSPLPPKPLTNQIPSHTSIRNGNSPTRIQPQSLANNISVVKNDSEEDDEELVAHSAIVDLSSNQTRAPKYETMGTGTTASACNSPILIIKNTPTRLPSPKASKIKSPFLDADRKSPSLAAKMTPIHMKHRSSDNRGISGPQVFRPGSPRTRRTQIPSPRAMSPSPRSPPCSPKGKYLNSPPMSPKGKNLNSPPISPKGKYLNSPPCSPQAVQSRNAVKLSIQTTIVPPKSPRPRNDAHYLSPTKASQAKSRIRKEEKTQPICPMPRNSRLLSPTKSFQSKHGAEIVVPEKVSVSNMKNLFSQNKSKPSGSLGIARAQSWKNDSAQPWKSPNEGLASKEPVSRPSTQMPSQSKKWKDSIGDVSKNIGVNSMGGRFAVQSRHVPSTPPLQRSSHRPDAATPTGPVPPTRAITVDTTTANTVTEVTPQRPTWKSKISSVVNESLRASAPDENVFHFLPEANNKPKAPIPTQEQVSELQNILKRRQTHEEQLLQTEMDRDDRTVETIVTTRKDIAPLSPVRSPRSRPWQKDLNTLSPQSWQRRSSSSFDNALHPTPQQDKAISRSEIHGIAPQNKSLDSTNSSDYDKIQTERERYDDQKTSSTVQKPSLDMDDSFGFENVLSDDFALEFARANNRPNTVALPLSPENFDPSPTNFSDVFFNDNPFRAKIQATILKGKDPKETLDSYTKRLMSPTNKSSHEMTTFTEFWPSSSKDEIDEALEWQDKDPDITNMSTPERVPKKNIFTKTAKCFSSALKRSKSPTTFGDNKGTDPFAQDTFKLLDENKRGDDSFDSLWGNSDDEEPLVKVDIHQHKKGDYTSSNTAEKDAHQTDTGARSAEPPSSTLLNEYPYVDNDFFGSSSALNESGAEI